MHNRTFDAVFCIGFGVVLGAMMHRIWQHGRKAGAEEIAEHVEAYTLGVRRGRAAAKQAAPHVEREAAHGQP